MNSWPRINEGYQYGRFNDASAARYIARRHPRDVLRAFTRSTHPAQRADVFRLAWLAADGGFYVDADDLCLAPISGFAPPAATLVGYREDVGTLANNFIGATRGHPVILRALELVTTAINRGDNDMIWLLSGPGLTTRAFAQVVAEDESILHSGATAIFELWQMTRVIAMHRRVGYKRTPRHWSRAVFQAKGGAGPHSASAGRRRSDGGQKP